MTRARAADTGNIKMHMDSAFTELRLMRQEEETEQVIIKGAEWQC